MGWPKGTGARSGSAMFGIGDGLVTEVDRWRGDQTGRGVGVNVLLVLLIGRAGFVEEKTRN